jgi:hypothetical protein
MEDRIKFLMPDGTLLPFAIYQQTYGLKGKQIAKYFWYTEPKFMQDLQDYGELIVCHLLMQVMDRYRELKKKPVNINAFNRDKAKQQRLHDQGFKTAKDSPHVEKMACDSDTVSEKDTYDSVKLILQAAKELGIKVRIGYKQYLAAGQTFIHLDTCAEYFGKGKPFHNKPHPLAWERESIW